MSGLKRRLTRRRAAEPEPAAQPPEAATTRPEHAGEPSLLSDPSAPAPSEGATEPLPVTELPALAEEAPAAAPLPADDLPAGLDAAELAAHPDSSARRGRLRRRIEFLRSARELLLRDLGGFVYELHRTARDSEHEGHRKLRAVKLARLDAVETELHALEDRLHDPRPRVVVREPGVGGECHRCGELFGSDANYCAHCGAPLTESARKARHKAERGRAAEAPAAAAPQHAPAGGKEGATGTPEGRPAAEERTAATAAPGAGGSEPAAEGTAATAAPGAGGSEPAAEGTAATAAPGAGGSEPAAEATAATAAPGAGGSEPAAEGTAATAAPGAGGSEPAAEGTAATAAPDAGGSEPAAEATAATAADGARASGAAPEGTATHSAEASDEPADQGRHNGVAPDAPTRVLPEPAERRS